MVMGVAAIRVHVATDIVVPAFNKKGASICVDWHGPAESGWYTSGHRKIGVPGSEAWY